MPRRGDVLDRRTLNRALLERQLLSRRRRIPVAAAVERLVGLQAQNPLDPYVGLWSRLVRFRPEAVSRLLEERGAVRMPLMRATIHLVSAGDAVTLRPVLQPVLERAFATGSPFGRRLGGVDLVEVMAAGRSLLEERPRTRAELRQRLGERWPDRDAEALAMAITYLIPVVQVPPRGLWGRSGQATWTSADGWLARPLDGPARPEPVIRRYLGAFGPATVADVQVWSGLTGIREVLDGIRLGLRTFADEQGRELFDIPGAPLPDRDAPAPPRFLPVFDNAYLSHADRSRIVNDRVRRRLVTDGPSRGPVLLDGFIEASWRLTEERDRVALLVEPFRRLTGEEADALVDEAGSLVRVLAPEASSHDVRLSRPASARPARSTGPARRGGRSGGTARATGTR